MTDLLLHKAIKEKKELVAQVQNSAKIIYMLIAIHGKTIINDAAIDNSTGELKSYRNNDDTGTVFEIQNSIKND